jgi:triphosphoribosyl-dephospho-CoA synthetase
MVDGVLGVHGVDVVQVCVEEERKFVRDLVRTLNHLEVVKSVMENLTSKNNAQVSLKVSKCNLLPKANTYNSL